MTSWFAGMLLGIVGGADEDWTYVVVEGRPNWSRLHLDAELPPDVRVEAEVGESARCGWLRYGEESSRRVVVLLDPEAAGGPALYVDRDRDLVLSAAERLEGDGRHWSVPLEVELAGSAPPPTRIVRFRRSAVTGGLSWGTAGHVEGEVGAGEAVFSVRRTDGDGNGLFSDARDLLWIDLDGDGHWDSFSECFPYSPMLELKGVRWALRSDRLGRRLQLEEVSGTGTVSLDVGTGAPGAAPTVHQLRVLLVGRDGSAVGLSAHGSDVEIPVGEWRVGMVSLRLADASGGPDWSFVFSDASGPFEPRWFVVERDQRIVLDPVGQVEFRVGLAEGLDRCRPGQELRAQPRLYTQDGLLINIVYRGKNTPVFGRDDNSAIVKLLSAEGQVLDLTSTGFA